MTRLVKGRMLMASRTQTEKMNGGLLSLVLDNNKIVCKQSCLKAVQLQATESYTVVHGAPCSCPTMLES